MADRRSTRCERFGMPLMRILGGLCGATVIALGVYDITEDSGDIGVVVNNIYRSMDTTHSHCKTDISALTAVD